MAILVTGGAGFIGSHFIELLLACPSDEPILCLDNYNDYYNPALKRANVQGFAQNGRVQLVEQSFCDPVAMRTLFEQHSIRQIVHLGAYAGVRPSVERPLVYQQANVEGTLVLLELARAYPVERFLLVSSSTVYGRGAAAPFHEDGPLGTPMSPYGASKRAAELFGLTYSDLHQVPVVCLRPFSVYGPRLRPDLAMTIFTKAILTEQPLPLLGDGSIRRDFTHVSDICAGLYAALTAEGVVGQCLNLGHDQPVTIRELITLLENAIGKSARIERRPEVPGEMLVTHANLEKSRRLLNYEPRVPFREGIVEFVDWYRTAGGH